MDMKSSRVENSIKNAIYAFSIQIFSILMAFAVRTVFIHTLGKDYLGFNGLFNNIFSILSLTELGVGTAIVYYVFRPG